MTSLQQVSDLAAEADEFDRLLARLQPGDWARPTQFKHWTVNDIVQHLHWGDRLALASATDESAFAALMADIQARRATGLSRVEETRLRLGDLTGAALRERWRTTLRKLCDALAAKPADARLKWAGPDMGVRMFTTARQMEVWSHAQAIYDLLGLDRPPPSPRLKNIAEIGVRTFGWSFRVHGRPVPETVPQVRLDGPNGESWNWNEATMTDRIAGDAVAFCQVVTQTRNIADTTLTVEGAVAKEWMSIAQCFAGPPETPPAKGTRFRMKTS
ncbi:TIGR03084 family protein [Enhydrobacter aerosaccus]|uniref:TIGR03084 family protein n=1 Tax=Enhydrobacter aerosaccus TaxID=225324 RepID=A0A1T4LHG1_9HYPH|nr:TIGR03084 family metal-binding protein [Enhydrobacter aerosaccus]SJZ54038.1 TIGR03084 family protein [Enhydrobacter aerosaccus]